MHAHVGYYYFDLTLLYDVCVFFLFIFSISRACYAVQENETEVRDPFSE